VISGDDEVDQLYLDAERRILHLFALQTPVASDLRLLTALLHINLHLERIADQAVNLAKITKLVDGLPQSPTALQHLGVGWQTVGSRPDRPDIRPCKRWVEPQFATVEGASGVASRRVVQVAGHHGVGDQI
jgi:hypothetical protein